MTYRLPDEPEPGPLAAWTVNPVWPLLAVMFGGAWLAWPWLVVNAYALGSASRKQEVRWVLYGFLATVAYVLLVLALFNDFAVLSEAGLKYALLPVTVVKLGTCYMAQALQSRSYNLYEYFGGAAKQGWVMLIVGNILGRRVLRAVDWDVWVLVLQ